MQLKTLLEGGDKVLDGLVDEAVLRLDLYHAGALFAHGLHCARDVDVALQPVASDVIDEHVDDDERAAPPNTCAAVHHHRTALRQTLLQHSNRNTTYKQLIACLSDPNSALLYVVYP